MKKCLLAVAALLVLISLVSAELSHEGARDICGPYGNDGETIQVLGPITCDGSYWICEFVYYGNKQGVVLAIGGTNDDTLPADSSALSGVISARYASSESGASLFNTLLSDKSFAVSLRGMNTTLDNYGRILKSVKEAGLLGQSSLTEFEGRITSVKESATLLASRIDYLYNASQTFLGSPDCWELADYLEELNETQTLAENFSALWNEFIGKYNTLANKLEAGYIAAINPSEAQILGQRISSIKTVISKYKEDEATFNKNAVENLKTRADRKSARDKLNEALEIVKNSKNTDAVSKYNEALAAFNSADYPNARGLANEAIALAAITPPDDGDGILVEESQDYSGYFMLIGALLVLILAITVYKKRNEGGTEERTGRKPKATEEKRTSWAWVKRDESSMEKKAS